LSLAADPLSHIGTPTRFRFQFHLTTPQILNITVQAGQDCLDQWSPTFFATADYTTPDNFTLAW